MISLGDLGDLTGYITGDVTGYILDFSFLDGGCP